jgi:hypothetical protein
LQEKNKPNKINLCQVFSGHAKSVPTGAFPLACFLHSQLKLEKKCFGMIFALWNSFIVPDILALTPAQKGKLEKQAQ